MAQRRDDGPIPYARLSTVFLDAGNTLVALDFRLLARVLAARGIRRTAHELRRAEAAARPALSAALEMLSSTETRQAFAYYLKSILENLPHIQGWKDRLAELAEELAERLLAEEKTRVWSWVLPGVQEALERLRRKDLQLVVVSNSDGTVEEVLERCGLRDFFAAVVDSRIVGFEKPDPRLFEYALKLSGAARDQTLHVGDLYDADVVGARKAGLWAVLLDPFGDWPEVDCDRVPDLPALADRILENR